MLIFLKIRIIHYCEMTCEKKHLFPLVKHPANTVDYTYQFSMSPFHVLDHFIVSGILLRRLCKVLMFRILLTMADHDPLMIELVIYFCKELEFVTIRASFF